MLRTLGQYTGKARAMARDFQRTFEDAAREADLGDVKELKDAAKGLRDLKNMRLDDVAGSATPRRTSASASVDKPADSPVAATPLVAAPPQAPEPKPAPAPNAPES